MSDALRPCPWCGAAPVIETVGEYVGKWFCVDADCPVSDMGPISRDEWNRRANDEHIAALDRLVAEMKQAAQNGKVGSLQMTFFISDLKRIRALIGGEG